MSENNYGALMLKSALDNSVDIKTVSSPGIYSVIAGNASVPNSLAATLQVLPPITSPKLFLVTSDGNAYHLTAPGWQVYGDIKTINGEKPDANGAITIDADDVGAVSANGGSYNHTFKFGRVETIPQEQNPAALFSQTGPDGSIVSGVEFDWYTHKIIAGIVRDGSDGTKGFAIALDGNQLMSISPDGNLGLRGNAVATGTIIGLQNDSRQHFSMMNADGSARAYIYKDKGGQGIVVLNPEGGGEFIFGKDGHFYAPDAVHAGAAILGSNGDITGTLWGGWLSAWLNTQFASANNLAQDAWNKANDAQINSVRASRRGPQQYINPGENGIWNGFEVPNGYFSGTRNHTDDGNAKFNEYWYRVQQIYIQSAGWVDTSTV
ncbi:hypothetical protein [Yokenella regensburgei]|uniref:hypothetical protein n=1 Tax=Yokenella regensburgei TaxID=158877 RepID=UPI00137629A2|nr:hypothetical protein [Yokenella regensburgei]KAF1367496.1 hypothetical protein FHR25_003922 [Yokenella regensburgei]